ncbi:MAG: right-handed parallel beta-helix repeat-containing protein [Abitibacteriaceae bacterium]|nr:right-handed parallel beta-helix repeat-containing protein [Abditibacteriaceae bacterium]
MDEARQTRRELMGSLVVAGTGLALAGASSVGAAPLNSLPTTDFGEKYDVRRFGAQGDGKTDDTRAVQTAIDAALKAGGGHIHFPAGQYRITRSLRFASLERVDVTGVGGSSTLLHENDEPLLLWPEGVSCREVSVRHLRVQSTKNDKSSASAVIACLGGVERSLFHHLLFFADTVRSGSGIITQQVADTTTLESCVMWRIGGTGLRVARGSEVRVIGGRITGDGSLRPENIGIHLMGDNGGVHVVTTDLIGLHTSMKIGEPGHTSNREVFITHATFDSSVHGLWQSDNAYTSIAGCWAASCDEEQILLDRDCAGAILSIAGGTIFNGGAYGRPGAHHGLVVRAGRFTLSGTNIRYNKGTGILLDNGARDYTITGCRIHNNGVGASLRGENLIVSNNLFAANGQHLVDNSGHNKQVSGNVFSVA